MLESDDVFDGMSSVRDNACVSYDVTTVHVEVNINSDVSTGNVNSDVSSVQIRNISNNNITGNNEYTIPDVSTVIWIRIPFPMCQL